jgi:uncharacterized membrane protein
MSTWHYAQNNQPCGPVDTAALQELLRTRGTAAPLPPDTLVWKAGMANWVPANTVPEFSAVIFAAANTPPPLPSAFGVPPLGGSHPSGNVPPPIGPAPFSAADPTRADIDQNKVFAVLAYIGILFLVPLLAAPQSPYARYHTNQGIVFFLACVIAHFGSVFVVIATFGLGFFLPMMVWVAIIAFMILGIVNAATGQCKPLPLIGHFRLI